MYIVWKLIISNRQKKVKFFYQIQILKDRARQKFFKKLTWQREEKDPLRSPLSGRLGSKGSRTTTTSTARHPRGRRVALLVACGAARVHFQSKGSSYRVHRVWCASQTPAACARRLCKTLFFSFSNREDFFKGELKSKFDCVFGITFVLRKFNRIFWWCEKWYTIYWLSFDNHWNWLITLSVSSIIIIHAIMYIMWLAVGPKISLLCNWSFHLRLNQFDLIQAEYLFSYGLI